MALFFFSQSGAWQQQQACKQACLDGQARCNARVDNCGGLSHDATSLRVTETVHKSADGPLHNGRSCEGDEPQSRTQDPAMARVTHTPALKAQRQSKGTAGWVSCSCRCCCHSISHLNKQQDQDLYLSLSELTRHRLSAIGVTLSKTRRV